jgi:hypothetical protein
MKRLFVFICLLVATLSFSSCSSNPGITKNAIVLLGDSQKFTKEEVQAAADCVMKKFKTFDGCNLIKLWYDEEYSNLHVENYMLYSRGSVNGIDKDNVIALLSDFYVDKTGGDGGFNPNSDYTNWNWILIRDSKAGNWRVDDWGY